MKENYFSGDNEELSNEEVFFGEESFFEFFVSAGVSDFFDGAEEESEVLVEVFL